jgi:mannose-6-phosphate isomerase-like protein (cupin superfamily)
MDYEEKLPRIRVSRKDMMKRVARFSKLKGFDGGLPDSHFPGAERTLFNVIGFQPPKGEGAGMQSPVGAKASRMAAVKISEGFNLGYCKALPGKGPMLHNHDTNETFIAITGTWRATWENEKGKLEHVDLKPLDLVSIPPGASRRFMNVTKGPKNRESILMFVIGGDAPRAEFTSESMKQIAEHEAKAKAPARKPAAKKVAQKPGKTAPARRARAA